MSNPWDERYKKDEFYYGTEPNDLLRANVDLISPKGQVLCLAEGEGRNAVFLARHGLSVTAVDGSKVGLNKMAKLAASQGVSVSAIVSDLAEFELEPDRWDGIVSIWCHVPPELRMKLHRAAVESLRPGGILILEAYHPRQLSYGTGGPPKVELMMTLEGLKSELHGLEFVLAREIDRDIHEGSGHFGKSAVVQVVARKP